MRNNVFLTIVIIAFLQIYAEESIYFSAVYAFKATNERREWRKKKMYNGLIVPYGFLFNFHLEYIDFQD